MKKLADIIKQIEDETNYKIEEVMRKYDKGFIYFEEMLEEIDFIKEEALKEEFEIRKEIQQDYCSHLTLAPEGDYDHRCLDCDLVFGEE